MRLWEWGLLTTLGTGLIFLAVAPIFKTGARHNVSGADFVISHTIFSQHPTDYIPEEELTKPLSRDEIRVLRRFVGGKI